MNLRRKLAFGLLGIIGLASTGCGSMLVGTWGVDPIPEDRSFYIGRMTFNDDGSYSAVARKSGEPEHYKGAYEFNGFQLSLKEAGKAVRTYGATYILGGTLELRHEGTTMRYKKL